MRETIPTRVKGAFLPLPSAAVGVDRDWLLLWSWSIASETREVKENGRKNILGRDIFLWAVDGRGEIEAGEGCEGKGCESKGRRITGKEREGEEKLEGRTDVEASKEGC